GYSLLSMDEQTRQVETLNALVQAAAEFQRMQRAGEMIVLDRGDGLALVFFRDPQAPLQCAVEVSRALRRVPSLRVRMGIHSGPVVRHPDITGKENVTGDGINLAARLMVGDAGHILLSEHITEDLRAFERWSPHLKEIGEATVKHEKSLRLF